MFLSSEKATSDLELCRLRSHGTTQLHHSSFLALTIAILYSLAFLHLPWRLCNVYRMRLIDLCSIVTCVRTLLQHCSSYTGCPSSTPSSSRSRRWCTTFYIMDVLRISSRDDDDDLVAFNTADSHRRQLRSSHTRAAVVKRTRTQFVKRAFSVCGPNIWNNFPPAVCNTDSHPAFRRALKSHLFQCAFIA